MAQRRMFSPKVIDTDTFLDMSPTAQNLYFHLGMRADDDGFITPKRIMRMLGTPEDDLKILVAKGFVIPFKSGVFVITHWKVNNLVRKDWYRETHYLDEKKQLNTKDNGEYTLVNEISYDSASQVRLGKDSIGKDNKKNEELSNYKELKELIINLFNIYYEERFGTSYNFEKKDYVLISQIIKKANSTANPIEELKHRCKELDRLVKKDKGVFWKFTLEKLSGKWNELATPIQKIEDTSFIDEMDMRNNK